MCATQLTALRINVMTDTAANPKLRYVVGFPRESGLKTSFSNGQIRCHTVVCEEVGVYLGDKLLAKISYSEELSEGFVYSEFAERAMQHAKKEIQVIVESFISDNETSAILSTPLTLNAGQIKELAEFAESDGQNAYTIAYGNIPEYVADDDSVAPAYSGLIAYSESQDHGVLQLD
jgi:hypothetical protein